ncbi:LysR family transcriptional regulator [Streptomyces sp. CB02923]|uniref:LysR family transcriptional regulator n=1 Tax=Streptomyces sp. CB02923 TaxID=1718985 RepID=UPI00093A8FCF|nr:LysR family transcriptional regulator [Streptomyces sp. CB02923]OKI02070.1 LysR family transcriptional regulator [Streptomyces sp. CB02923]
MIDLRLLQTLRVLHAQATVTATARALNLSPSAVSQQLRQLSRQVGADLLVRDGRRLRLTEAGRVLLSHADALTAQWERVRADLSRHDSSPYRTLRVGGFATSMGPLLAPAAQALLREPRPVGALLTETDTDECFRQLLAGELDIAVLTPVPGSPPQDDERFDQQPLLDEFQDLAVPSGHPLAVRDHVELADAATEDWISAHHDQNRLARAVCTAAGFAPRMTHHAEEWHAVLAMVAHGLGVCLVPRLVSCAAHAGVVRVPVLGEPRPLRRVLTCVRRGSHRQAGIARGLAALRARAARVLND